MVRDQKPAAGASATDASPNAAQFASWAENGCQKSAGELIKLAKASGDAKAAALATRAEGGCEHSKAELITWAKETETTTKSKIN